MRTFLEEMVVFLVLIGFCIFSGGALFSIHKLSQMYRTPLEITIALIGLTLIVLGVLAAKLFSEVEF